MSLTLNLSLSFLSSPHERSLPACLVDQGESGPFVSGRLFGFCLFLGWQMSLAIAVDYGGVFGLKSPGSVLRDCVV